MRMYALCTNQYYSMVKLALFALFYLYRSQSSAWSSCSGYLLIQAPSDLSYQHNARRFNGGLRSCILFTTTFGSWGKPFFTLPFSFKGTVSGTCVFDRRFSALTF